MSWDCDGGGGDGDEAAASGGDREEQSTVTDCVESMAMIANSEGFDDLMKLAAVAVAETSSDSASCYRSSKMLRPDASCKRRRTPRRCCDSDRVMRINSMSFFKQVDVENAAGPDSPREGRVSRVRKIASRILQILGDTSFLTEKSIRQLVGNNPDTSKALRILLKADQIWRIGDGGKPCPYRYYVTKKGFRELEKNPALDSGVDRFPSDQVAT